MLAGSISNDKLSNSSSQSLQEMHPGGVACLGGTVNLDVGVDDSSIEMNTDSLRVKAGRSTNDMLAGSISNDKLSNRHTDLQKCITGGNAVWEAL